MPTITQDRLRTPWDVLSHLTRLKCHCAGEAQMALDMGDIDLSELWVGLDGALVDCIASVRSDWRRADEQEGG